MKQVSKYSNNYDILQIQHIGSTCVSWNNWENYYNNDSHIFRKSFKCKIHSLKVAEYMLFQVWEK